MNSNNAKPDYPVAEDGLPQICLEPRNGQVIVTPHSVRQSSIALPDGQMSQLMYEKVARVLAAGPGRAALFDGSRQPLDLKRGDLVVICASDATFDGTLEITDPSTPILLLAVDENSIVAKIDGELLTKMIEERKAAEGTQLSIAGE